MGDDGESLEARRDELRGQLAALRSELATTRGTLGGVDGHELARHLDAMTAQVADRRLERDRLVAETELLERRMKELTTLRHEVGKGFAAIQYRKRR